MLQDRFLGINIIFTKHTNYITCQLYYIIYINYIIFYPYTYCNKNLISMSFKNYLYYNIISL